MTRATCRLPRWASIACRMAHPGLAQPASWPTRRRRHRSPRWPRARRLTAGPGPLRQGLRLERVELRLVDGAAVEQLLGLVDLGGRTAVAGHRADVVVHLRLLPAHGLGLALGHPLVLDDQVRERADERQHDEKDRPHGLAPA